MANFGKELSVIFASGAVVLLGAPIGGGYIDMANNTRDASTDGSNPKIVEQYQQRIQSLSEAKPTMEGEQLYIETENFFSGVYATTQLSEKNVEDLTREFTAKVGTPQTFAPDLLLERPEYLDECKADMHTRDLEILDQCTLNKHQEAISDGPWMGAAVGAAGVYFLGTPAVVLLYLLMRGSMLGAGAASGGVRRLAKDAKKALKPKPKHGRH